MLESGEAEYVVVARLDRLTRSVQHFTRLIGEHGDRIICLDPELDTTTASGRLAANVFASFAQYERDLGSERTRAGLAVKKANGWQPGKLTREDRAKIVRLFRAGRTVAAITREMSESLGRQVHRTSVANVVRAEVAGGRRGSLRKLAQRKVARP